MTQYRTVKKKKRRLNPKLKLPLLILTVIVLVVLAFFGLDQYERFQIREIGYSNSSIAAIDKLKIRKTLIEKNEYSDTLQQALLSNNVYIDYLDLYFIVDDSGNNLVVTEDITILYRRLIDKGYSAETIHLLLSKLTFRELTPLLVFDLQADPTIYIEDVIHNRSTNINQFELDNSYIIHYEFTEPADLSKKELMLVNKNYYLPEDYAVEELVMISNGCRLNEMMLEKTTAEAYETMCADMKELGMKIASTSAYRSYETQLALYDNLVSEMGQTKADQRAAHPGFSEHQTGYAVDIASLTEPNVAFYLSPESDWLKENAYQYGFINRYQEGYESITGVTYEAWHYRYVGVDLAIKINESGLTFDEYYLMYLADYKIPLTE